MYAARRAAAVFIPAPESTPAKIVEIPKPPHKRRRCDTDEDEG
jgi:hypothetical protein